MRRRRRLTSRRGQAVLEYVLLLVVVCGLGGLALAFLPETLERLERPLRTGFKLAYKNGFPDACGFDDNETPCGGGPSKHPKYQLDGSFRLFGRGTEP